MKRALILIDIQNDYFPGGNMELEGSARAGGEAPAFRSITAVCRSRFMGAGLRPRTPPGAKTSAPQTSHDGTRCVTIVMPD